MDDKQQLSNHGKPVTAKVQEVEPSPSCPAAEPIARSPHPSSGAPSNNGSAPDSPAGSPKALICRLPHTKDCRECLGAMAHRLAQPITALRGGVELALMGKRSAADYRLVLESTLQLADTMAQMIVSLRDLGESGAPGGPTAPVSLEAAIVETVSELEGLAQSRGLRVQLDLNAEATISLDPERLREALQGLFGWVIQNCAGGGVFAIGLSASPDETRIHLSPPRLDLQYLQIKVLEDITTPGILFSHAAKNGALGWAINQRLVDALGGKLEILTEGPEAGHIQVRFQASRPV